MISFQVVDVNFLEVVDDLLLEGTGTYYLNDGTGIFSTAGAIAKLNSRGYEVVNIDSDTQPEIIFQNHQAGLGVMDFM